MRIKKCNCNISLVCSPEKKLNIKENRYIGDQKIDIRNSRKSIKFNPFICKSIK